MEIVYKDFIITGDNNDYTLTEYGIAGKDSKTPGEKILKKQTYYPTLEMAIIKMARNSKVNKDESIKLEELADNMRTHYQEFKKDIKTLINKQK